MKKEQIHGVCENHLNIELFCQTLARIIGEKEGVTLTYKIRRKDEPKEEKGA